MAIYMKVPYASGSVSAAKYKNWIEIQSLQLGVNRSLSMETGSLKERGSGVPRFTAFSITKYTDDSSPGILGELVQQKSGKTVEIVVVEGATTPSEVVKYILKDALISSYSVSASGEKASEQLSFVYSEIEMAFTARDTVNKGTTPIRIGYDLKSNA